MASTAFSTVPKAVIRMTAVSGPALWAYFSSSNPLIPGMEMSLMTTS